MHPELLRVAQPLLVEIDVLGNPFMMQVEERKRTQPQQPLVKSENK